MSQQNVEVAVREEGRFTKCGCDAMAGAAKTPRDRSDQDKCQKQSLHAGGEVRSSPALREGALRRLRFA